MALRPMNWRKAEIMSLTDDGTAGVPDDVQLEGALRLLGPLPSVGEGLYLGRRLLPRPLAEEDVVGGVGVEGRVQVDQVHRFG